MISLSKKISEEFEQHYKENYLKVYNLALGLTGNKNDAEEITQEAFLKALCAYDSFRKESSFFTWIYRITLNVSNDYLKQRKKMPVQALTEDFGFSLEEIKDENPANNPETLLLAKEARFKCFHCLTECLPNEQRKIFCLAVTIGLPYRLVAEILECSISKVKTTIYRAKQRWFGYMEDRCELIKKSNPCRCIQWVRFGLQQGWIKENELEGNLLPEVNAKSLSEVRSLKALRDVYTTLYPKEADDIFRERIKDGIKNNEWSIIS